MNASRQYISRMTISDGVIMIVHRPSGRGRILTDLWHRLRFVLWDYRNELPLYERPFRAIKSFRAAVTKAWTFDMKLRQSSASRVNHN